MKRLIIPALLVLSACAGTYKHSYVTGAITKEFATESYGIYSDHLNEKIEECDPDNNDAIKTKSDFDECLGNGFKASDHDKIKKAVEIYHSAAKVHSDVMVAAASSDEDRKAATQKLVESALALIALMPNGEELVKKFKRISGVK